MSQTLLLVDGSSYLYRAFHAMAPLTAPDGTPTGALYGVLNMLRRLRADYVHDYCAVVFDAKGKNFRHQMFPDYKATRPPMPDELRPQAEMLPEMVRLMGWPVLVVPDVEADDVIGTLAKQGEAAGWNVVVSTGDKDMAQLVSEHVTLVNTMSNEKLDIDGVKAKFGVRPDQIIDYLTLMGDKVDNVPGVEKCGPKTAVKWLEQYGTLQGVIEHAGEIKGKVGENLQAALPQLPLSYQLVTIKTDVDLHAELSDGLESLRRSTPKWSQLAVEFKRLNFRTWLKEAEERMNEGNGDLFGAAHIGEQAALATEQSLSENPSDGLPQSAPRARRFELPSGYHRSAVRRPAGQIIPSRSRRHRHRDHLAQSDGSTAGGHQHGLCRRRGRVYPAQPHPHRRARTAGFKRSLRPSETVSRKCGTQKNRPKPQIRPTYFR